MYLLLQHFKLIILYQGDKRYNSRRHGPDPVDVGDDVGRVEPHRGRGDFVVLLQGAVLAHCHPAKETNFD